MERERKNKEGCQRAKWAKVRREEVDVRERERGEERWSPGGRARLHEGHVHERASAKPAGRDCSSIF